MYCIRQYKQFNPKNLPHFSQCTCNHQNLHRNCVLLHSQKSKISVHKSICTVLHNTNNLIKINLPHFSQCTCKHQNLHRNFVLLHSQKSKISVHKSICTVLDNTSNLIQKIYHTFLSVHVTIKTYTEIVYFCIHRNPKLLCINPYVLY